MSDSHYRDDPELDGFGDVMDVLGKGRSDIIPEPVPEDLWGRISDEIAASSPRNHLVPPTHVPKRAPNAEVDLAKRRSATLAYAAMGIAAAIVLLVLVPLALAWQSNRARPIDSVAQLDQLEQFAGGGTATLRGDSLELELDALPGSTDGSSYEVWAIDFEGEEIRDLVSLGTVNGSTELEWPEGTDPEEFSFIDVSVEPDDGNPEHSGSSVLRGELS